MRLLPRAVRILLARQPADMRNSIDGLAAIVRAQWKGTLYAGHLFVFVSRRGDKVKILSWDAGSFDITYKRLEQGRFHLPAFPEDALGAQLDATQPSMLLDGIDVTLVRRLEAVSELSEQA
ncbi:IS66 family insertion sequence element accessory protein TnpB [Myxococcus fulvus]|uniref:IS66 family insertion sequence element accessory protein TnpB n=1 Tax=Myxococcus fulvus TaxID=33 RepID=UPI003B9A1447